MDSSQMLHSSALSSMSWLLGTTGGSWLQLFWLSVICAMTIAGAVAMCMPNTSIYQLITYGKTATYDKNMLLWVRKSYFTHFYVVGMASSFACLALIIAQLTGRSCAFDRQAVIDWLNGVNPAKSTATQSPELTALLLVLLCVQTTRRFYESAFVSVYSFTRMNVAHYLVGMIHYSLLPVVILAHNKQVFIQQATSNKLWPLDVERVLDVCVSHKLQTAGLVLFVVVSLVQHTCIVQLAMTRRLNNGTITTYAHSVPSMGLFEYCACPHFLCECLLYVSLLMVNASMHGPLPTVTLFVFINQFVAARITHRWYKLHFPRDFPPNRAAILPGVF